MPLCYATWGSGGTYIQFLITDFEYNSFDHAIAIGNWGDYSDHSAEHIWEKDTWYMLTVIRTPSATNVYLDKELAVTQSPPISMGTPGSFVIGSGSSPGAYPWKGNIDDVRVYNKALSTDEINALYNGGAGTEN